MPWSSNRASPQKPWRRFSTYFQGLERKSSACLLEAFAALQGGSIFCNCPFPFPGWWKHKAFNVARHWGSSKPATSWHKHAPYWNRTLANFAKRPALQLEPNVYLWAKMATVPTQCLQKVASRSNRCPCNQFHFREKIFRENAPCPEAPTGCPHKTMAQVFHIFPGPGKKKHCLLAGSFCNLTGRQYLLQLPLSCLWLVKAQGFSCCKALGEQANLPHHDTNMRPSGIEPWPILQKGLLCS